MKHYSTFIKKWLYKLYLPALTIACSVLSSKAQPYQPLLKDSATWYIYVNFEGCFTITVSLAEDSSINNQTYRVLRGNNCYSGASNGYPFCPAAFFREDTAAKKVYVIRPSEGVGIPDTAEHILYDFSLQKGDSIFLLNPKFASGYWYHFPDNTDTIGWCVADSIYTYSTLLGDRKAISFTKRNEVGYPAYIFTWVEGIGAIDGPYLYGGGFSRLNCYYEGTIKGYTHSTEDTVCICSSVGINEIGHNNPIRLYPNPSTGTCTIMLDEQTQIQYAGLYNSAGNEVLKLNSGTTTSTLSFTAANLLPGIYFIRVQDKNGSWYRQKWIKE